MFKRFSLLTDRRNRALLWAAPVLALNWLSIALLDPDPRRGVSEVLSLGYFFGSLFGQTTLAAAWAAFGPGRLWLRVPLSLTWVFLLSAAIATNIAINGGPDEAAVIVGACFLAQWLLLQIPLWGMKAGLRAELKHADDQLTFDAGPWQFGIRQLLIVTTIVGIVFGVGRLMIDVLLKHFDLSRGELPVFLFLAVSAIVFSLPLLIAALLERWTIVGVAIVLLLIGLGTLWEAPLLRIVTGGGSRPGVIDLLAINVFTSGLILIIALVVRWNGYHLTRLPAKA